MPAMLEGTNNRFSKPAWYDSGRPYWGLSMQRKDSSHEQRRRIWNHAFSTKGSASSNDVQDTY